jgi:hypothetical protein
MSVGYILLCHAALNRAAQVARHWAEAGAPVVIHVDARVPAAEVDALVGGLADLPGISFSRRFACEWGTFGLVEATLAAAGQMLVLHPETDHVCLVSGSCLPLRPHCELAAYLAENPHTDFIESVTTDDVPWIVDGLAMERFTLRFPFAWRRQRRLFDGYVRLQRRVGYRRRLPDGLVPHLGSQWWCLTRQTLGAVLNDPRRATFDRFFRRAWIPDEGYFQSLVRLHSCRIESRSLTLSKFDVSGRPHVFYDDHLQLLRRSDCFIARKIWPEAQGLYDAFLDSAAAVAARAEPQPGRIDLLFEKAGERRRLGRPGLIMQSRWPARESETARTAAPYSVFHGFSDLFEGFDGWLAKSAGGRVHGHLLAADRVQFAGGEPAFNGTLSDSAALRDYNPRAFLTNLIWATRGERQIFQFSPRDSQSLNHLIATDNNAQVSVVSGAWAIPLFLSDNGFAAIRAEAARLQKIERDHLALLRAPDVKARVRIWSLVEFLQQPMTNLQVILDEINPRAPRPVSEAPRMRKLSGFGQFLQSLKNHGMHLSLTGDFPATEAAGGRTAHDRPYLVG